MRPLDRTVAPRRLAPALLALVLYLGSAVGLPLAHAQREVLGSAPEIEVQHGAQCARIHAEPGCLLCTPFQLPAPLWRAVAAELPTRPSPLGPGSQAPAVRQPRLPQHGVRAPPAL